MDLQSEPLGQERLNHLLHLTGRSANRRRFGVEWCPCIDVETSGIDPIGTADELEWLNTVGELNQRTQPVVLRIELTPLGQEEPLVTA